MPDAIDEYLDDVLAHASLAPGDERRVRGELKDHLEELAAAARENKSTHQEILNMLHTEFGKPEEIGKALSAAKGRFRTYVKKQKRKLPILIAIGLILGLGVRFAVAEVFHASWNGLSPAIPSGSYCLVYKLGSNFHEGDAVVFQEPWDQKHRLGLVKSFDENSGMIVLSRQGEADVNVPRTAIVGRIVMNTR